MNNRLFFTLLLVFSLLSSLGGVDNSSYETDVEKLLIEAIIPGGEANNKRSELVVIDLSEGSGRAIVDDGSVIEIGRGDLLLDGPAELFEVSYVTNSPEKISIKVDVDDFVLVKKDESGNYVTDTTSGSEVTLAPTTVTREISYSFSDLYDIPNVNDEKPKLGYRVYAGKDNPPADLYAHGFEYKNIEENNNYAEGVRSFTLQYFLREYVDSWEFHDRIISSDYWEYKGASLSDEAGSSLLKGFFEIHQTFSISLKDLKDVSVIEKGYYKMDVTVTLEVVA